MRHLMDAFQQAVDEARRQLIRDEGQDVSVRSRSTAQVLEQVRTVALEVNGTWPSPTACLLARSRAVPRRPGRHPSIHRLRLRTTHRGEHS